ncbi:MAG: serine/threonine-protein kinase [Polyangiaceae bacterium]
MANTAEAPVALSHLDRYELITQLGEGGMAKVYLGLQRGSVADKLVVVKLLREAFSSDPHFVAMFADESRIAVRLSHPNVIHTYEASTNDSRHYIVMEFLEAKTLAQLLRRVGRKNMPLDAHLWVLCEVLSGLAYAHELADFDGAPLQIVHRDVSPSNVLCTIRGEVKLVDFGIAKVVGALAQTQHGMIKGKLGYASPEQCQGEPADGRADVYAVGVMLWEALAGQRRALRESALATMRARSESNEIDIVDLCPNVSPRLAAITRCALAADPANRYASAREFERELRDYLIDSAAPSGSERVQTLVSEYFGGEIAETRAIIDRQVRTSSVSSIPTSSVFRLSEAPPHSPSSDAPQVLSTAPLPAPPRRSSSWRRGAVLSLLVAASALGAWVYVRTGQRLAHRTEAAAGTREAKFPSLEAAVVEAVVEAGGESLGGLVPAPAAPEVRLHVRAWPSGVELRLDGVAQSNPLEATLRRDDREHVLSAEAKGCLPERRIVRFDRDQDLRMTLAPQSAPGRHRAQRTSASWEAKLALPTSKPDLLEPGLDLRKQARLASGRPLDERDPYVP